MVEQSKASDFNEVWGDKEPQITLEAIAILAEGQAQGLPTAEVQDILSERFLVVPGNNSVADRQMKTLEEGYQTNPEGWDAILGK